jgi:4-amino-4-deoxy-L-arabinose transferase-like glycosyltransferase
MAAAARDWRRRVGTVPAMLLLFAVIKVALHLATATQLSYHEDELYYLDSSNHLQLGYVDYPPLTPLIGRLATTIFGQNSLIGLRLFPALAGAAVVVLAGLVARELGGSDRAQILAGLATLTSPLFIGANWLFQTVSFDQLLWLLMLYTFIRLHRTGNARLWLLFGLFTGLALENKYTVLALIAGIVVATLVRPSLRRMLRTPYPWLGALIAGAVWAPNLAWEFANGWPSLTYTRDHAADISASGGILNFLLQELLSIGPAVIPFWLLGWWHLLRTQTMRSVGVAAVVAFLVLVPEGKSYYPGPLFPLVLAAASIAVDRFATERAKRWPVRLAAWVLVVDAAVALPFAVPVLPEAQEVSTHLYSLRGDFSSTIGWDQVTDQVARAWYALSAAQRSNAVILAQYYAEAGAIDHYGPALGLPEAISPHLTYWYWKPPVVDADTVLVVGWSVSQMQTLFHSVTQVGVLSNSEGVHTEASGLPILVCTEPITSLDAAWPSLQDFS